MKDLTYEKHLTGLLVIDPYNDFISQGGKVWPIVQEVAEAISCVSKMKARKAGEVSREWPENGERRNEWVCWVVEQEQGKSGEIG